MSYSLLHLFVSSVSIFGAVLMSYSLLHLCCILWYIDVIFFAIFTLQYVIFFGIFMLCCIRCYTYVVLYSLLDLCYICMHEYMFWHLVLGLFCFWESVGSRSKVKYSTVQYSTVKYGKKH